VPKDIVGGKQQLQYLFEGDSCLPWGPVFDWVGLLWVVLLRTLVILSWFIVDSLERQRKRNQR